MPTAPSIHQAVQEQIEGALARVRVRFDAQLRCDLPPVQRLVNHVEHYRGKMLRPTLSLAAGLACTEPPEAGQDGHRPGLGEGHVTVAAVCEMVHMATLVHDDVLDDADTRRRGATVNRLHGNEAAVILGDYLIASAYHLCSQLDAQAAALLIGQVSMSMAAGELLQLWHRGDHSLDEPTYFEIVERKTAALVGAACRLGAWCSGADTAACRRMETFGSRVGVAFQIQDDVLDIAGREAVVGKSLGKDLEKGKLTLPLIHHLAAVTPRQRGRTLLLLEDSACGGGQRDVREALEASGSLEYARGVARSLVEQGKRELDALAESPAREFLRSLADAAVDRNH
ncbi:MAG: polyprenyl synthetase family protein [Phycisphaerales bacterium]|nr:polyprenyl synthetase family protein [Phycisphaerales bacterium]